MLRTLGLGVMAAPGFQWLSAQGQTRPGQPTIRLEGPRKTLSVDAVMASPDGVRREIFTYGGQLIGPTIRVKEGERMMIEIVNNLKVPTIVHWHGMHQPNSWQMDGVEGVSGPAIAPGRSFLYDFVATPAGTHWYHSHAGVQYSDGLFGPLIVEERQPIARYDREEILLINDWEHEPAETIWQRLSTKGMGAMGGEMAGGGMAGMAGGGMAKAERPLATSGLDALIRAQWGKPELDWGDVPFRSGLMNGRGRAAGTTAPLTELRIRDGEVVRLRLINGSATYSLRFQIDHHPLTVIASDGQPLQPVTVDNLLIGIGERYDVLVTGKGSGSHWIRATTGLQNTIKAVLRYSEQAPKEPAGNPEPWRERFLAPSQLASPKDVNLAAVPFREIPMVFAGPEPVYRWSINGEFYPDVKPIKIKKDEWIRMRFVNRTNMEHPFHIHGHSFYILGTPGEMNLRNPPLKDTLNIWPNAEQVIQWKATNPGHWIFHCHVEWHLAGGMASLLHISA
ncbi:MAG: multicopper oxidase family protein [Cyanobacteriota bacterium]|nr:multicopper oxidase family protein [Cyanobacteriota bacterium]